MSDPLPPSFLHGLKCMIYEILAALILLIGQMSRNSPSFCHPVYRPNDVLYLLSVGPSFLIIICTWERSVVFFFPFNFIFLLDEYWFGRLLNLKLFLTSRAGLLWVIPPPIPPPFFWECWSYLLCLSGPGMFVSYRACHYLPGYLLLPTTYYIVGRYFNKNGECRVDLFLLVSEFDV